MLFKSLSLRFTQSSEAYCYEEVSHFHPYVDVVDGGKMITKDFIGRSGFGNREVYKDFILVSTGKLAS